MTRKVCILAAGLGTRMGPYADQIAKTLLPVGDKAVLSHIIERFPDDTKFVIAIGHLGQQIRTYIALGHPDLDVTFVEVDVDPELSDPGESLLACKEELQEPFYLVTSDTMFELPKDTSGNWIGVNYVEDQPSYCNAVLDDDNVVLDLIDKKSFDGSVAFTGLAHFEDYQTIFKTLDWGVGLGLPSHVIRWINVKSMKLESMLVSGLRKMAQSDHLSARFHPWEDTGTYARYREVAEKRNTFAFEKDGEFIYRVGNRIVKYFADRKIVHDRVRKTTLRKGVFPNLAGYCGHFYAYEYIPGETMYECLSPELFSRLLAFMRENVWEPLGELPRQDSEAFYVEKTLHRLEAFRNRNPGLDTHEVEKSIRTLSLPEGVSSFIHGDLQFDNILVTEEGGFCLIDWRQDFAGHIEFGDLYYDFAKLLAGIVLDLRAVKEEGIFRPVKFAEAYIGQLAREALDYGLDFNAVKKITGLVYLNMAGLHGNPIDLRLFELSQVIFSNHEISTAAHRI